MIAGRPAASISLFLPWYSLTHGRAVLRAQRHGAWICGVGNYSCTGWETFPIAAPGCCSPRAAPLILA